MLIIQYFRKGAVKSAKKGGKHGLYGNPDTSHLQAPINSRRIQLQESLPILHKVSKLI